jgi:hypothetical protein
MSTLGVHDLSSEFSCEELKVKNAMVATAKMPAEQAPQKGLESIRDQGDAAVNVLVHAVWATS